MGGAYRLAETLSHFWTYILLWLSSIIFLFIIFSGFNIKNIKNICKLVWMVG
jgi:hypothetical protein